MAFTFSKDFFHQRLTLYAQYITPRIFLDGHRKETIVPDVVSSCDIDDIDKTMRHSFVFTVSYRFQEGKSVRQYERNTQEEK